MKKDIHSHFDSSMHDVIKTKENLLDTSYYDYSFFTPDKSGKVPEGSLFLIIRRRKIVNSEFAGRKFQKIFEQIALSPDGRIIVLDKTRCVKIA